MVIIQDTREKSPFDFNFYDCDITVATLKTGDYTIQGYEDIIAIERKCSTSELAGNLGKNKIRFDNAIERLSNLEHAYIVCEFSREALYSFPKNSGIPKSKLKYVRMNGKYMVKCLYEYEEEYGIKTIFCNNKQEAEEKVIEIFTKVINQHEK